MCGVRYHYDCLTPKLAGIPDDDWICSVCSQNLPEWAKFKVHPP